MFRAREQQTEHFMRDLLQNDAGHVQSAAPATKTTTYLVKTSQKYCACHTKRLSTRYKTRLNVTKCHAYHAKRSNEALETSNNDPSCRTYHRHGHRAIARTVAHGCERLRAVANRNATSSEHTLSPQAPRVKREPLLRIREKKKKKKKKKKRKSCGSPAMLDCSKTLVKTATMVVFRHMVHSCAVCGVGGC